MEERAMLATHKTHCEQFNTFGGILMLSAWGFCDGDWFFPVPLDGLSAG